MKKFIMIFSIIVIIIVIALSIITFKIYQDNKDYISIGESKILYADLTKDSGSYIRINEKLIMKKIMQY